ncbi:3204_t:CDS:10 [Diversispora eburnea]|uniref:3204_t:CDS:1 n=1 Tax=Diversispora eburnea TaxID=1213867 RepID=A0A9N8VTG9_9GLOM|nr:3204_t:CDS:10 [Diversispora eburnea]
MDSYPQEFIYHHVPLMFVMGLGTMKDLTEQVTITSPTSPVSPKSVHSRQSSFSSTTSVLTKHQLSKTLLSLLTAKSQNGIWESGKIANPIFHVMAVDKSYQFPPRKPMVRPQQIPPISNPHSSLSPLNPNSPVYPDGLIPPAWVHKHREILPSVFVGFYDLWHKSLDIKLDVESDNLLNEKDDSSSILQEPLGTSEPIEKEKDLNLGLEINEKRKSLYERGIKFAVVILLRSQHLDEQITDDRLSYIRKASGLEGKSCFFALSPHADLSDFASNLQKALYEHGLNYYREHGKRVRRKRSRFNNPGVNYIRPPIDHSDNAPLGVQGWLARYDYKLATFAEFRLQTRSKRWIEARILADCINLKICKMNLYIDSPSAAMMQLNKHFNTFNKLCNTVGIGESTFEYWAWLSRQYRVFGEMLEIATRSGYNIPDPLTITHSTSSDYRSSSSFANTGVNPSLVLQHPGFYYHLAAKYNSIRGDKFLEMEKTLKNYDKNWHTILESILRWSLKCAKESSIHKNIMDYYIELLCDQFQMSEEMRVNLQNEFINMMNNNEITNSLHVVDMNDINSFLNCYVHYKEPETFVGTSTDFQVTFSSPPTTPPIPLRFSFLRFSFNDEYFNHYLIDNEQEILSAYDKLQLIDCKDCQREEREGEGYVWVKNVDLTISKNSTKVFEGSVIPRESGELQLRFDVNSHREENLKRKWLTLTNNKEQDQQGINQKVPHAKLDIKVKYQAPALLDEYFPIELTMVNLESDDIKALFHAEIVLDPSHNGTNHLKNIDFGIIPTNGSLVKTIFVIGKKSTNIRDLNFGIYYAFVSSLPQSLPPSQGWIEKRMEIRLSFITPFSINFNISPQGERFVQTKKLQKSHHRKIEKYLLKARISNTCPWDINVSAIDLVLFDQANAQTKMDIIASSTETINESLEQVWKPGHIYNFICLLKLVIIDDKLLDQNIDIGLLDIQWKR